LSLLDTADWYQFTTVSVGARNSSVSINYDHTRGDLVLELYDAGGNRIDYSSSSGVDTEAVTLYNRPAGTYWLRVVPYAPTGSVNNPNYSLTLSPPPADDTFEPDNTQATAANLGTLTAPRTLGNLRLLDGADWYKLTT